MTGSSLSFNGAQTLSSVLGSGPGLFLTGGATTGNYVSIKSNSVAGSSPELLMTSSYTALKRNDGANSIFVEMPTVVQQHLEQLEKSSQRGGCRRFVSEERKKLVRTFVQMFEISLDLRQDFMYWLVCIETDRRISSTSEVIAEIKEGGIRYNTWNHFERLRLIYHFVSGEYIIDESKKAQEESRNVESMAAFTSSKSPEDAICCIFEDLAKNNPKEPVFVTINLFWAHMIRYTLSTTQPRPSDFEGLLIANEWLTNPCLYMADYTKKTFFGNLIARVQFVPPDGAPLPEIPATIESVEEKNDDAFGGCEKSGEKNDDDFGGCEKTVEKADRSLPASLPALPPSLLSVTCVPALFQGKFWGCRR